MYTIAENSNINKQLSILNATLTNVYPNQKDNKNQYDNYKMIENFNNGMYAQSQACFDTTQNVKMELDECDLWNKFHQLTNEMILTKAGRRTFPLIKTKISGLESETIYSVVIEFRLADGFKYRFVNGEWRTSNRTDISSKNLLSQSVFYTHSDSPNFGKHWNNSLVSFNKLKLTNNETKKSQDTVFLKSLHKYDPVVHIFKLVDNQKVPVFSTLFKETQFIAVTAYQNEQITNLKIKFNPFAKAFLDTKPICIESITKQVIQKPLSEITKQAAQLPIINSGKTTPPQQEFQISENNSANNAYWFNQIPPNVNINPMSYNPYANYYYNQYPLYPTYPNAQNMYNQSYPNYPAPVQQQQQNNQLTVDTAAYNSRSNDSVGPKRSNQYTTLHNSRSAPYSTKRPSPSTKATYNNQQNDWQYESTLLAIQNSQNNIYTPLQTLSRKDDEEKSDDSNTLNLTRSPVMPTNDSGYYSPTNLASLVPNDLN